MNKSGSESALRKSRFLYDQSFEVGTLDLPEREQVINRVILKNADKGNRRLHVPSQDRAKSDELEGGAFEGYHQESENYQSKQAA